MECFQFMASNEPNLKQKDKKKRIQNLIQHQVIITQII